MNQCGETRRASPTAVRVYVFFIILKYHIRAKHRCMTPAVPATGPYNISMPRQSDNQSEPLLIDRAAAAELPSADGVREWAREKRAFISSVMTELAEERQAVAAGIRGVGLRAVLFEEFGGRDADPEAPTRRHGARDDAVAMQFLIPGWSFDDKRPCLVR